MSEMEVKPGYKQTELGAIPEDWGIDSLSNKTSKIGSGITPTGGERVYKKEGKPFIRSQNVGWGSLNLTDVAFIDLSTHESFIGTEIKDADLLLNITGASIGRCSIANEKIVGGNVNQHVCIIRVNQSELNPRYVLFVTLSRIGQAQIDSFQAGGNRQGLNFEQIGRIIVPIPPLPEQTAIATALSDVDALISGLDRLIEKKRAIKQAAMLELLTGKRRLPGFSGEWNDFSLKEIFSIINSSNLPRENLSEYGDIGYIHYGDIHTYKNTIFDCSKEKFPFINSELVKEIPLLRDGDLIMVDASEDYSGLGKSFEIKNVGLSKIVAGLHTIVLRGDDSIISNNYKQFIQFLPMFKLEIIKIATGISVYGVSKSNLSNIEISLPPLPEQTAIATVLSDMDTEISALEARKAKTISLKQGMMQELLTGRIRLV